MGRKKLPEQDKKYPIKLFLKKEVIELNGGKEEAKEEATKHLERKAKTAKFKKNIKK